MNPKNVATFALSFNDRLSSIEPHFKIQIVKPEPRSDLTVENERVNVVFKVTKDEFRFSMRNRSNVPVQLDWNSASYVDPDGKAQKVMPMPKGLGPLDDAVKLIDRNRVQTPSVIPPGGSIEEQVIPFDSVQHDSMFNKWLVRPFVQKPDAWSRRVEQR